MEKSIEIKREKVFAQVARRTEWQGTRSPGENDYGRLTLSEADKALFHSFFDEAAMHALDICRPFLTKAANTDEALTMTLTLPHDAANLEQTAENMLTSHVLGLWQEIVSPQRSESTLRRRDEYTLKLQSIIYHHPAPVRSIHNA